MLYRHVFIVLFVLLVAAQSAYLHRVPGLLGDEASEGENVYELLDAKQIVVVGERSYIGPFIDYVRVPAVLLFGYSTLALRVVMFLFSLATFVLAAIVLRKLFGPELSLFMMTFMVFSPVYLLEQRLGWAIALIPFFAFLTLFFLTSSYRHALLLAGLSAGLGLANHVLFLPTLIGVVAGVVTYTIPDLVKRPASVPPRGGTTAGNYARLWPSVIGFWAGFAMQATVLVLFSEDQGNAAMVIERFGERLIALPALLPLVLSGSSYVARYTGSEFSSWWAQGILWTLTALIFVGVLLAARASWENTPSWRAVLSWIVGLIAHLMVLLLIIDRFSLRYFVAFSLGVWALAGLGAGHVVLLLLRRAQQWAATVPIASAAMLLLWVVGVVLVPFLKTGGSTRDFSLGNRTDSAAAHVDIGPLVACLRGAGPVFSENIHIWNRLRYLSHLYSDLEVVTEGEAPRARWLVHYRLLNEDAMDTRGCKELRHFRVESNDRRVE